MPRKGHKALKNNPYLKKLQQRTRGKKVVADMGGKKKHKGASIPPPDTGQVPWVM